MLSCFTKGAGETDRLLGGSNVGSGAHASTSSCLFHGTVDIWRLTLWITVVIIVIADTVCLISAVPPSPPQSTSGVDIAVGIALLDCAIVAVCIGVTGLTYMAVYVWRARTIRADQKAFVLDGDTRTAQTTFWHALVPWSPTPPPALLPEDWNGIVKRDHVKAHCMVWFNQWSYCAGNLFCISGSGTDDFGFFRIDGYVNRDASTHTVRLAWTQTYRRVVASRTAFADTPDGSFMTIEHRATLDRTTEKTIIIGTWRMGWEVTRPGNVSEGHFILVPLDADFFPPPMNDSADLL